MPGDAEAASLHHERVRITRDAQGTHCASGTPSHRRRAPVIVLARPVFTPVPRHVTSHRKWARKLTAHVEGVCTSHFFPVNTMARQLKVKVDAAAMSDGCWIIIYEDEGYQDKALL